MKFKDTAKGLLLQANARLDTANRAFNDRNYSYTIRQSQECVELSLKASLRYVGVEYPKLHDVSEILLRCAERFPSWFKEKIREFSMISKILAKEREPAMYGEEEKGLPPEKIFNRSDAKEALENASNIFMFSKRLLKER